MKLSLLTVSAAAAVLLTACASGTKTVSEAEPVSEPVSPESIVFSWQQVYQDKLAAFRSSSGFAGGNSGSMFDLCDLNGDGTPELIISPSEANESSCEIYSASGNVPVSIGTVGNKGTFGFIPAINAIDFHYIAKDFELREFFKIEENSLVSLKKFYNNKSAVKSGGRMVYEVDNQAARIADYEDQLAELTSTAEFHVGRKFSFSEAASDYALHCSESWGAVLNDTQKELFSSVLDDLLKENNYDAAFELCDIDRDNVPELIVSDGSYTSAICSVYRIDGISISKTAEISTQNGILAFDPVNNVCYDPGARDPKGYKADGSSADGFTPSDSLVMCGRKFMLREDYSSYAFR